MAINVTGHARRTLTEEDQANPTEASTAADDDDGGMDDGLLAFIILLLLCLLCCCIAALLFLMKRKIDEDKPRPHTMTEHDSTDNRVSRIQVNEANL